MKRFIVIPFVLMCCVCMSYGMLDNNKVGCAHVDGMYSLTSHDYLNEGAITMYDIGFRVIKTWFTSDYKTLYPYHSTWPTVYSMKALADAQYYRDLFGKPFKTFILEAYAFSNVNWHDGLSQAESDAVYNEFRELTEYLCQTYTMSGKVFVLQDWEGDNALGQNASSTEINGMIAWLNARQDGIDQGRIDGHQTGVLVVGASEVSRISGSSWSGAKVVDAVVPFTHMDLYSYSIWEAKTNQTLLINNLNYLKNKAPDSSLYGQWNIYMGECGLAEYNFNGQQQKTYTQMQVETGQNWGCRFMVYWQVYDNGENGILKGWWLVRDDGSLPPVWSYFYNNLPH